MGELCAKWWNYFICFCLPTGRLFNNNSVGCAVFNHSLTIHFYNVYMYIENIVYIFEQTSYFPFKMCKDLFLYSTDGQICKYVS